ncbi:hypothetical protein BGZ98_007932 [Dissophora globulifera]|nr:hypothetical protein BGZ98_007932 [Dissophora globulifera]
MPQLLNPPLIPEILERISLFVSAWTPHRHHSYKDNISDHRPISYTYCPQDLLACALTSRLWYHTFYRQLWTVIDGDAISSSHSTRCGGGQPPPTNKPAVVPEELLLAYSAHCRVLTNYSRRVSAALACRHLVDLTLYGNSPQSLQLVRSNPGLKRLTWIGAMPDWGMVCDLETDAMSNLTSLQDLTLQQWDISDGKLLKILRRNTGSLVKLRLKQVQGLDVLYSEQEEKEKDIQGGQDQDLIMERLEELTLDFEWIDNFALLDFIKQCTPKLQRLQLSCTMLDDARMMGRLAVALAETHPELKPSDAFASCYSKTQQIL